MTKGTITFYYQDGTNTKIATNEDDYLSDHSFIAADDDGYFRIPVARDEDDNVTKHVAINSRYVVRIEEEVAESDDEEESDDDTEEEEKPKKKGFWG